MNDFTNLLRANIRSLIPYSSARDEYSGEQAVLLDANENPYGNLNRYPDPLQKKLKRRISEIKNVPPEQIFIGNGSDEAIDLLYRIFCNPGKDRALIFTPTYGMYEVCARINDIDIVTIPLDADFDIPDETCDLITNIENLKLIIICTPNNPTGNSLSHKKIESVLGQFKGIVAIDEAYSDFSDQKSFTELLPAHPNLVILQTFSKAWGLAAARVGMAFGCIEMIQVFNKVKYPYNVSQLNQQAALDALDKITREQTSVRDIIEQRKKLAKELTAIKHVMKIYPSDANFLLVKVSDANAIYNHLVKEGIIVRNRTSVVIDCLRITIGTPEENDKLINALKKLKNV